MTAGSGWASRSTAHRSPRTGRRQPVVRACAARCDRSIGCVGGHDGVTFTTFERAAVGFRSRFPFDGTKTPCRRPTTSTRRQPRTVRRAHSPAAPCAVRAGCRMPCAARVRCRGSPTGAGRYADCPCRRRTTDHLPPLNGLIRSPLSAPQHLHVVRRPILQQPCITRRLECAAVCLPTRSPATVAVPRGEPWAANTVMWPVVSPMNRLGYRGPPSSRRVPMPARRAGTRQSHPPRAARRQLAPR